jgi:hypothetical protein
MANTFRAFRIWKPLYPIKLTPSTTKAALDVLFKDTEDRELKPERRLAKANSSEPFWLVGKMPFRPDTQTTLLQTRKTIDMFGKKCPACGVKLGDFLYADACPHCHEVLKHNLPLRTTASVKLTTVKSWPIRAFFRVMRFVES